MPTLKNHRPRFHVQTAGGSCVNLMRICDGEQVIARLCHETLDEPEHELLYFGNNPRPVLLRSLRLSPAGRPLFEGVQMYWQWNRHHVATTELLDIDVAGNDSERLSLTVVTRDPHGIATSTRIVTVTYDPQHDRYRYSFDAHLDVHHPGAIEGGQTVELELADPWYADLPAPSQPFAGMWKKRPYTHFLIEQQEGPIWAMPINHRAATAKPPASWCGADGRIIAAPDPGANPVIQLCGSTGLRTRVEVCWWAYDMHLITCYDRAALQQPVHERFVLTLADDAEVESLLAAAPKEQPLRFRGQTHLPYYQRTSSFARGGALSQPCDEPGLDPFPWEPAQGFEQGASWCHDCGRSDSHSLKIDRLEPGMTRWITFHEGQGGFAGWWPVGASWQVACWVKTEQVRGCTSVGVRWHVPHQPVVYPVHQQAIRGTNDWTRLEVIMPGPAPRGVFAICLVLEQQGAGTSWFDDLEVVPIRPAPARKREAEPLASHRHHPCPIDGAS